MAYQDYRERVLEDPETRSSTKAALVKEVIRAATAGDKSESFELQRRDAMTWLRDQGMPATQVNILVQSGQLAPPEYIDKLQEVVDVEATPVDDQ